MRNKLVILAKRSTVVLAAVSALAYASADALAQSRLCRQLEAQLAATTGSTVQSSQYRKYDRAAKTQREQLQKAKRRARRAGCKLGALSLLNRLGNTSQCTSIAATISRMESNLAQIERRRERYDRGGSSAKRSRILARIHANDCRGEQRTAKRRTNEQNRPGRLNILEQIFNGTAEQRRLARQREPLEDINTSRVRTILRGGGDGRARAIVGSYRTLCVRTCDGYYFPVSFSATEYEFDRDRLACQAMCPGTDVELYYHKVPGEESEDMMSVFGEPYADLKTAFLYRQPGYRRDKSCGCSRVKNFSTIAGDHKPLQEKVVEETFIPAPTARPDPAADPETLANRQGNLTPKEIDRILTPAPDATANANSAERKIRVVGPAFLPDPEGAAKLQAPDQNAVQ